MTNDFERAQMKLWISADRAALQSIEIDTVMRLRESVVCGAGGPDTDHDNEAAVTLQMVEPLDGVVAVAYMGAEVDSLVALNGIPLEAGMHPIRPTDRLDIGTDSYWLAEDSSPRRTRYDPERHGPDARCAMTKARLQAGQEIVICPGRPGTPCQVVYKAAAWDAVMQSNRDMRCPRCGYRPHDAPWRPPEPRLQKKPLDELRHFAPQHPR